ncbi:MAG: hypothetical protein ACE37H_15640 [Phycisphaeraceae bacterium]
MKTIFRTCAWLALALASWAAQPVDAGAGRPDAQATHRVIGGVYPHLAVSNSQGECGIGAVVPWAERLWVATYSPHRPMGSDDKLWEITPGLGLDARPESIGGTPANRMIHRESNQLIIANYFIDAQRNVRAVPHAQMPGRPTANARHLSDPANKVYFTTMEEGLYEVDVRTLAVRCWINDANRGVKRFDHAIDSKLPGYHGKGAYTGQGRLFYSNNGEHGRAALTDPTTPSGALAHWGGPGEDWRLIEREQYTEVTGPGGLYGNANEDDPVWAMGWDHRSVLLKTRDHNAWHTFRLPKASFSYDGAHGWNTEWPRIREIGEADRLLATMHGTFWAFPSTFSSDNPAGIRPRSNYLKVVGDFARWGDRVVLGCDDSAQKEFLNTRKAKSKHSAPLRSNSNLWFIQPDRLDQLGPALGSGGVWLNDDADANQPSHWFLFAGYERRVLHLAHRTDEPVTFVIEAMAQQPAQTRVIAEVEVPANGYAPFIFNDTHAGEWVRVTPKHDAKAVTAWFHYAQADPRTASPDPIFTGLATDAEPGARGGLMRSLGGEDLPMGLIATTEQPDQPAFYLLNKRLELVPSDDATRRDATAKAVAPKADAIPITIETHSVLVEEDGRRYRLPLYDKRSADTPLPGPFGHVRRVREVVTERDLMNVGGTFYELPARNAGGFAHVRPVASHPYRIHDFCSYRGLLVMTGVGPDAQGERIVRSADGHAAVWVGVIDELWQLGKPTGVGGPWHDTQVQAGQPSDPYLMYGYDKKRLRVRSDKRAEISIQFDPSGTGNWHTMGSLIASPDEQRQFNFWPGVNAHWVRLVSDTDATITATFIYE